MAELMMNLVILGLGFFALTGPIALRAASLGARDRRENRLTARVLGELNAPDLRGLFTVRAECRALGPDTVHIDLWGLCPQRAWEVMVRVSDRLPAQVRLEVGGVAEQRSFATWSLTVSKQPEALPCCAHCH